MQIRPPQPSDVPAIRNILDEVKVFYGSSPSVDHHDDEHTIHNELFGSATQAHAQVADTGDDLVGLVTYSFLWPASGVTRSLFIKELFVLEAWRGRGIGTALMNETKAVAANNNCSRIDWTVDAGNEEAFPFYRALGAEPIEKVFFRLELG